MSRNDNSNTPSSTGRTSKNRVALTRRGFLRGSAVASATTFAFPTIIPRSALAEGNRPGANDRIRIAGIGVGRQGSAVLRQAASDPRTDVVCICDVNQPRGESIANAVGAADVYQDYRRVLDRDDVDAIVTATPEHWRANICIAAALAGKHVYAEKPLTLTIPEGRLMVKAARKTGITFQVGSQQRSQRANFIGCEFIRNGGLGEIKEVHAANYESPWLCELPSQPVPAGIDWNMWCGPTELVPYNKDLYAPRGNPGWLSIRPYSGGEMTGWGTHGFDQIQWALGLDSTGPTEILVDGPALDLPIYRSPESRDRGQRVCSQPRLRFRYANGLTVHLDRGNRGGGIFVGEKAKMEVFRGRITSNPSELAQNLLDEHSRQDQSHVGNWLDCCVSGERPIADVELGHRSATVCHLLNIGRLLGRNLRWDPDRETFVGDDEANEMLTRPIRKGFELPTV
ncbi:Gfo/Idh/MocA family protein [Rhodopirellula sallentina]|uniref:Oxidoreductase domain-containing protein n=1 Tax=Rhodopirellula sallentina SM41 TaxID=1263870 RepID=M5U9D7_9BACT|nr:Gfo/Idh/MocA family oxidoreductase [Rhodopirellula sallentina]EMI58040.1 oxidoreductase domain-containing protein [Rhodopirellula sallentina SM41]